MTSENVAPPNDLVAAVLSTGIRLGIVGRAEVVAWADWLIDQSDSPPPPWLIDLSLSQNLHLLDILSVLNRLTARADRVALCKAIYAFIQPPSAPTPDEAEAFAQHLYEMTYECLDGDWNCQLLREADDVSDAFQFIRDGDLRTFPQQAIEDVLRFHAENRDERVNDLLARCMHGEARSDRGP